MLHAALRRGAVLAWLACCAPLAGCARTGGDGGAATAGPERFDGWYQGRQTPLSINPSNCRGRAREVWFEVENGAVEMRNARQRRIPRKRGLLGTVSADGSVDMRPGDGGRSVSGRIEGDRLTIATVQEAHDIRAVQAGLKAPCAFRYEASRAASPGPGGATPPVGRFPQP
jgi:hypothetical protein